MATQLRPAQAVPDTMEVKLWKRLGVDDSTIAEWLDRRKGQVDDLDRKREGGFFPFEMNTPNRMPDMTPAEGQEEAGIVERAIDAIDPITMALAPFAGVSPLSGKKIEAEKQSPGGRPKKYATPEEAKAANIEKTKARRAAKLEADPPPEKTGYESGKYGTPSKKHQAEGPTSSPINKPHANLLDEWLDMGKRVDEIGKEPSSERFTGITVAPTRGFNTATEVKMEPPPAAELQKMAQTLREQWGVTGRPEFKDLPPEAQQYVAERAAEWQSKREAEREKAGGKNTRYLSKKTALIDPPASGRPERFEPKKDTEGVDKGMSRYRMNIQERQALEAVPQGTFNRNYPKGADKALNWVDPSRLGPRDLAILAKYGDELIQEGATMWRGIPLEKQQRPVKGVGAGKPSDDSSVVYPYPPYEVFYEGGRQEKPKGIAQQFFSRNTPQKDVVSDFSDRLAQLIINNKKSPAQAQPKRAGRSGQDHTPLDKYEQSRNQPEFTLADGSEVTYKPTRGGKVTTNVTHKGRPDAFTKPSSTYLERFGYAWDATAKRWVPREDN